MRGDIFLLVLSPDAREVFKTKTHSGVLCSGREELWRPCLGRSSQRAKQNTALDWKGHVTARKKEVGRSSHRIIRGRGGRRWYECGWWPPTNRSQLLPSCSSPDIFDFTLPFLLHKPSPMNIPIMEFTTFIMVPRLCAGGEGEGLSCHTAA